MPVMLEEPKVARSTRTSPLKSTRPAPEDDERPDIFGSTAFILVHLAGFLAFYTGVSWVAFGLFVLTYGARMFAITGGYHRYFAHRTFKTSRIFQFCLAWLGASSAQQGPLWWAAHHRHHHQHSDTEEDLHSPIQRGFWWAHLGWIVCKKYEKTNTKAIPDFAKYPELRFLNDYHMIPPIVMAGAIYGLGALLARYAPGLHTNGLQMFVWGFVLSTILLYHATFCINSLAHVAGSRRFNTRDHSRNNVWLAIMAMGEGWHNNHHRCPYSERQGFYWWEVDFTHYILRGMSYLGLVWNLQRPPQHIYEEALELKKARTAV